MQKEKTARIQLAISPTDKALFERAAKAEKLSLSAWLRIVAEKAARKVVGTKDGTRPTV